MINLSLLKAFFEGSSNVYEGAKVNFSGEKIVIREIGDANKHSYSNAQIAALGEIMQVELLKLKVDSSQLIKR